MFKRFLQIFIYIRLVYYACEAIAGMKWSLKQTLITFYLIAEIILIRVFTSVSYILKVILVNN